MITAGITIGIILVGGIAATESFSVTQDTEEKFDMKEFQMGFTSFSYQLRSDGLVMLFMIPLIVGLFIASKNCIKHGESMMVFIAGMLLIAPIPYSFYYTDKPTIQICAISSIFCNGCRSITI